MVRTPHFLSQMPVVPTTQTFFFNIRKGGARTHTDSQCGLFACAHFVGTKHWRLTPFNRAEEVQGLGVDRVDLPTIPSHSSWTLPVYEADVGPGELLVFYPGWWHATQSMDTDGVLTLSTYWDGVAAHDFNAEFDATLRSVPRYRSCGASWEVWAQVQQSLAHLFQNIKT